jgi:hypothetical protein
MGTVCTRSARIAGLAVAEKSSGHAERLERHDDDQLEDEDGEG